MIENLKTKLKKLKHKDQLKALKRIKSISLKILRLNNDQTILDNKREEINRERDKLINELN